MTVGELIAHLNGVPQSATVVVQHWNMDDQYELADVPQPVRVLDGKASGDSFGRFKPSTDAAAITVYLIGIAEVDHDLVRAD